MEQSQDKNQVHQEAQAALTDEALDTVVGGKGKQTLSLLGDDLGFLKGEKETTQLGSSTGDATSPF